MAERVVDVLEMVQIEKQQGTAKVLMLKQRHLLAQAVEQQCAIGQPGQRVVISQVLNLRLGIFKRADVAGVHQQAGGVVQGDELDRYIQHQGRAMLVSTVHFPMMHAAFLAQFFKHVFALQGVGPDTDLVRCTAEHFLRAETGQASKTIVDLDIAARVDFSDGDRVGA